MTMPAPRSWSFLVPLLLFTLLCAIALGVLAKSMEYSLGPYQIGTLLYFFLITGLLLAWQEHGLGTDPSGFVRRSMAGMVIKMMSSLLLLLVVVLLLPRSQVLPFAIPFILLYLAFMGFSTMRMTRTLRNSPSR